MKTSLSKSLLIVLMFSLVFQSALERIWSGFSYIDESIIVLGLYFSVRYRRTAQRIIKKRLNRRILFALVIFLFCGALANLVYRYQPLNMVLIDIIANTKFFFAIFVGYQLLRDGQWNRAKKTIREMARLFSYCLFVLYIFDLFFHVFGGQIRYGIRSAVLFYPHSTYLAGMLAFLLACLVITYNKRNRIAIIIDLLVMVMTLRSKAIVSALMFVFLFWLMILRQKKLKTWQIITMGIAGIGVAWSQIDFYYLRLAGASARSVLLLTSLIIMKDYFPIGTGFGTYASHSAAQVYSPVYIKYGFNAIHEVSRDNPNAYLDDTFWPIIFGQTGAIGTICYFYILGKLGQKCFSLRKIDKKLYMATVYILVYLIISSIAEPIFSNSIAVPLGLLLGLSFRVGEEIKRKSFLCIGG